MGIDYKKLGFRAGLEIHQQLDTSKLFCSCPSVLTDECTATFERTLRPTASEMGEVDRAAREEAKRGRKFIYLASPSSCLVEADEEPPHEVNREALETALIVALMMNAEIMDEIHFMRKIVIDGSNTTGFQRTALIAMNGEVDGIPIESICLEEDAARKVGEEKNVVKYALDRLGIPLVEIATAPEIKSPKHAREIAEKIGLLLRATKRVKRGIGTIRQDVNVSIRRGNRVEIKGVQELNDIPIILENEVKRQLELIEVAERLKGKEEEIKKAKVMDVGDVFKNTECRFIKKVIEKGGTVMGIKLPGFAGLIGGVKYKEHRLGREFAMHAKKMGGGIMHSDELPAYGISNEEVGKVRKMLKCGMEDAFVISASSKEIARKCLLAVKERAMQAVNGVPREVRRALQDGFTEYMRPMPGAARMYPETDVPPIRIRERELKKLMKMLPEHPEEKMARIASQYGISREDAKQIVYSGRDDEFEMLASKYAGHSKVVARILLHILPEIRREGYGEVGMEKIDEILHGLSRNYFAKEAVEKLMHHMAKNPSATLEEAMKKCGVRAMDEEEVRKEVRKIIEERREFIMERKMNALSPLMGVAMKSLRGKADGGMVSRILKEELQKFLEVN